MYILLFLSFVFSLQEYNLDEFYNIIQNDYKDYYDKYCKGYQGELYNIKKIDYVEGYGGGSGIGSTDISKTNIQKEGVDESDIIKVSKYIVYYSSTKNKVYIVDPKNFEVIKKIGLIEGSYNISLYTYNDDIIIIGERYINENIIYILRYDLNGKLKNAYFLKGQSYNVRLVKNNLYLVSQYSIYFDCFYPFNKKNLNYLSRIYKYDGKLKKITLNNFALLYPYNEYSYNLKYVYKINLDSNSIDTKALATKGSISNIHMTDENLYIVNGYYEYTPCIGLRCQFVNFGKYFTHIVKINLNTLKIISNEKISGYPLDQYSMDDTNGFFRIFTVNYNPLTTNLYIFDKTLKLIGKLENIAPGETFKGARFLKDKAFLITYETKDPLFLIDLSNNQPKVVAELHIPGYSIYLHPIYFSEKIIRLLGIGHEADQFGNPRNIKIDLYEVDFDKKETKEEDCSKYTYDNCPLGCSKNPCGSACEPGTEICIQVCVPKCEGKLKKENFKLVQKDSIILGKEENYGYPHSTSPIIYNPRGFVMKNDILLLPLILFEEDPEMIFKMTKKPYYVGYKKIKVSDRLEDIGGLNIYNILYSIKDKLNILPERNNLVDLINYDYSNNSRVIYYGDDIYYFGPDIAVKNKEKAILLE